MKDLETGLKGKRNGFSITEILTVLAIIAILLLVTLPALGERLRGMKARTVANDLVADLRAARHTAITKRQSVNFTVRDEGDTPPNQYTYTNAKNVVRTVDMPNRVRITAAPAAAMVFKQNGALNGGAETIVIKTQINESRADQYTVSVSVVGSVTVDYASVAP